MKKIAFLLIVLFAAFSGNAQDIYLTQVVKGTVIDEQSGNVLSNATVSIEGKGAVTDSLGNFKLKNIPIGRQMIRVTLMGISINLRYDAMFYKELLS